MEKVRWDVARGWSCPGGWLRCEGKGRGRHKTWFSAGASGICSLFQDDSPGGATANASTSN